MQIEEIMTRHARFIPADASLRTAAETMSASGVGFLPVREGGRLVGVVTDRDLALRPAERSKPYDSATVADVMSPEAHSVRADTPVAHVAAAMGEKNVQRLLVLDDGSRVVGVVSLTDVAARCPDVEVAHAAMRRLSRRRAAGALRSASRA